MEITVFHVFYSVPVFYSKGEKTQPLRFPNTQNFDQEVKCYRLPNETL